MLDSLQGITNTNEKQKDRLTRLEAFYGDMETKLLLQTVLHDEFKNQVALFSSFGADSALLISLVAEVDPAAPILFLDTEKHFEETLEYVESLRKQFGLKDIRILKPDPNIVKNIDPNGTLWSTQPNRCCWMRKVEPLQRAVREMNLHALITGRKRYQTHERGDMTYFQIDEDGVFRINPLAYWSREKIKEEFTKRHLPAHPLVAKGYKSIGCAPCTLPVAEGQDERDGRWAHTMNLYGEKKNECGLHLDKSTTSEWSV
jgi:phosphoadenosine phosphosulfate reductase